MSPRHEEQQRLLQALRASGAPEAQEQALQLGELYHAREMAGLSHDVYDSAREIGSPPAGWIRGSENPGLLRAAMPALHLSDLELLEALKPEASGFRAEIYLPDPDVLGPGYRPTVVFKGSANEVREADGGLRSTAMEDFLGNNFPQSIGLQTDYYDRAMDLAVKLKAAGLDFDLSGHSLGGGMAAAASAVSGMSAVTHNAAGLHPDTAARFARESGGLPLYDTGSTVTAWQVQGDLLNDGVQGELRGMSVLQRERMATLLSNTVEAMQRTPAGRDLLEERLVQGVPEGSQPALRAFLDRLEQGNAASLIRDLPEAAGQRRPPLAAMTQHERELVERESRASLGELQQLGGPVLTVAAIGARGANTGAAAGEVVAAGGRMLGSGIDAAGDLARDGVSAAAFRIERTYSGAGVVLNQASQAVGEVNAYMRMGGAQVEAALDRGWGWAQYNLAQARGGILGRMGEAVGYVSGSAGEGLEARADRVVADGHAARERGRADAADALARGRSDARGARETAAVAGQVLESAAGAAGRQTREGLVYAGERLDAGLDVVGDRITRSTSHAPTVGAGVGGTAGVIVGGALLFDPRTPHGAANWYGTIALTQEASPGLQESVGRHGMDSAMLPSMDRHIAEQERAARELLQRGQAQDPVLPREPRQEQGAAAVDARGAWLGGDLGSGMEQMLAAARSGSGADVSRAARELLETSGGRAWLAGGHSRLGTLEHPSAREGEAAAAPQQAAVEADMAR